MQLRGVVKAFPNGTLALRGVDLDIDHGKVHGLLGANGLKDSIPLKWRDQVVARAGLERSWQENATLRARRCCSYWYSLASRRNHR